MAAIFKMSKKLQKLVSCRRRKCPMINVSVNSVQWEEKTCNIFKKSIISHLSWQQGIRGVIFVFGGSDFLPVNFICKKVLKGYIYKLQILFNEF